MNASTIARTFRVGCELTYQAAGPGAFILSIGAAANDVQRILSEQLIIEPGAAVEETFSPTEEKRQHRFRCEAGPLTVRYQAEVEVRHRVDSQTEIGEIAPGELPSDVVPYLYPSRYCESDMLVRLAGKEFGPWPSGFARVTAVCNWIYDNVEYLRGTTNPMTSAYDTATERAGVCRDFAHLAIAFCRALAIPARFVAGYALHLVPPDFHACFEAYLGGRWYFFDATRLVPQTGFVRIGLGRDAADTSFATIFGPVTFGAMNITMEQTGGPAAEFTTGAVSM